MITHNDIWVFIEQEDGKIADVSLELLAKARELAQQLQSAVCGVVCSHRIESLAEPIIHHGTDCVLLADHPELENYRTLGWANGHDGAPASLHRRWHFGCNSTSRGNERIGKIVNGEMQLNAHGEIARAEWLQMAVVRPYVMLHDDEFVVMPNHVHGII